MMHGPCGLPNTRAPCMVNGKCIRFFTKKFHQTTIVDQDGFPVYRRRNNGRTMQKHGIELDNRFVVPYSPHLLLKYRTHLNMKWCNHSTSIKYLFKYINKGSDRITTTIVNVQNQDGTHNEVHDEIKLYLDCRQPIGTVLSKSTIKESMITTWMDINKIYHHGRDLTYAKYVSKFIYDACKRCWQPRKQGNIICMLIWVPPSSGELFYMRMMLSSAKGSQSYKDIRIVENIVYHTFKEACFAKGFLGSDKKFICALQEANTWGTPHFLRKLFVKLLFMNTMDKPEYVWEQTWQWMAGDIAFISQTKKTMHLCLTEIENLLQTNRKSLRDFPSMSYPIGYAANPHGNKLIYNELAYDKDILAAEFNKCYHSLTDEKTFIFDKIMHVVATQSGGVYFLYGYVPATQNSTCNIHQGSDLAELLQMTKLIIWDEASMCHRYSIEALDKSLKDIMHNDKPFGGKDLKLFFDWLLDIDDAKLGEPNDGYDEITIPDEFLIKDFQDPIQAIVEATYPDLLQNYSNGNFLQKRVVLASTKDVIDKINDYVLSLIPSEEKEYCSADSVDKSYELLSPAFGVLTPEFLNSLKTSGIPNHKLKIKVGTPIILLRNLDQADGLCNGTRLIVTRLGSNVVEAEIITGPNICHRTYIPRMNLSPSDSP
uniref:ATP-dependent DNA helicase n=1 Tax=Glycine max TaxID=3847 RepID=A0A0R0L125_SOYBN